MATVGSLIVDLVANTASFISGMKSSQQMVVDFKRTVGGGFTLNIDASKAVDTISDARDMVKAFGYEFSEESERFAENMSHARDATQMLQAAADKASPAFGLLVRAARELQAVLFASVKHEEEIYNYMTAQAAIAPDTAFNREAKQIEQQNQRDQARIDEANKSVSAFNDAVSKGPAAFMQQLQDNQRFAGLNEREQVWQRMIDSFKGVPGATEAYKKSFADAALAAYDEAEARKAAKKAADDESAARKQVQDTLNAARAKAGIDLLFGGIPGLDLAGLGGVRNQQQGGGVDRAPSALQFGTNAAFTAEGNASNALQQAQLDAQKKIVTNTQQAADQLAKFQGAAVYRIT